MATGIGDGFASEETVAHALIVEFRAGIGVRERDLNGLAVEFLGVIDGLLDGFFGFARETDDEVAVNVMPTFLQFFMKAAAISRVAPFLMFFRIWASPDSKPTMSRRQPASAMAFRVS